MVACVRFRSAFRCSGGDSAEGGRRRLAPVDRRIISGCPSALEASAGPAIGGGAVRCDDGHGALYGRTLRRDGLAWNLQGVLVLELSLQSFLLLGGGAEPTLLRREDDRIEHSARSRPLDCRIDRGLSVRQRLVAPRLLFASRRRHALAAVGRDRLLRLSLLQPISTRPV